MDRRAWWATVRGVTKSRTRLSDSHTYKWILGTWRTLRSKIFEPLYWREYYFRK